MGPLSRSPGTNNTGMVRSAGPRASAPACGATLAARRSDAPVDLIACSVPSGLVDFVETAAVGEMRLLRLLPVAEVILELEQRDLFELLVVFLRDGIERRAIEIAGCDFLTLRRVPVLEVCLRYGACALLVDDLVDQRNGRLGEDADGWDDDLDLVLPEFLEREI